MRELARFSPALIALARAMDTLPLALEGFFAALQPEQYAMWGFAGYPEEA